MTIAIDLVFCLDFIWLKIEERIVSCYSIAIIVFIRFPDNLFFKFDYFF